MEKTKIAIVDTCALMHSLKVVENIGKDHKLIIPGVVLEELDKHKDGKDSERCFRAREALKYINTHEDELEFELSEVYDNKMIENSQMAQFDMTKNDNKILFAAYKLFELGKLGKEIPEEYFNLSQGEINNLSGEDLNDYMTGLAMIGASKLEVYVLTYDVGMKVKAKSLGIGVIDTFKYDKDYKGYRYIKGDTDTINACFDVGMDIYSDDAFVTNEYILIHNTDTDKENVMRWDGDKLVTLRIPQIGKDIKPKNLLQKAAIDLLFNQNIPIKVICGTFGSGKTYLAVKSADILLTEGKFNKLLLVRNPVPADNIDIGALPGDKSDKVGSYFKPMLQYLEEDFNMFDPENEKRGKSIECEIVSFMKGISIENTCMIVDEAEDLNLKLLKMVGTRVGQGSTVIFTGDYKQAESKYRADNGLKVFIEKCKGNPLVGIIMLEEDVRSDASKIFADL